jgi:hypothetical protein
LETDMFSEAGRCDVNGSSTCPANSLYELLSSPGIACFDMLQHSRLLHAADCCVAAGNCLRHMVCTDNAHPCMLLCVFCCCSLRASLELADYEGPAARAAAPRGIFAPDTAQVRHVADFAPAAIVEPALTCVLQHCILRYLVKACFRWCHAAKVCTAHLRC